MTSTLTEQRRSDLARRLDRGFGGPVLGPDSDRYDEARASWHRTIDPRPAVVAEATGPADVATAIRAARDLEVPFGVQSTGHGTYVPVDGGLLVKTSRLSHVDVDPQRQVARVGAGALWSDAIAAATPYGLATLSSVPGVGVAGYTLGGGAGWLARSHGFAADALLSADVVTADGVLRTVSADDYPDLFWALRGGGGNFGVVTALTLRLQPLVQVYSGTTMYPVERAPEVLAAYREWAAEEPDELNTAVTVMRMPEVSHLPEELQGRRVLAVRVFSSASADDTERHLAPLRTAGGEPLLDDSRAMTFAEAADATPAPSPMAIKQQSEFLYRLPDDLLDRVVSAMDQDTRLTAIEVRHWGGAMARPGPGHGPVGHRDVPFSVTATAMLTGAHDGPAAAAVDEFGTQVQPYATGGAFLNFLPDPERTADAYTAQDYRRLREIKHVWDPGNVLGANHNIPPAGGHR